MKISECKKEKCCCHNCLRGDNCKIKPCENCITETNYVWCCPNKIRP